MKPGILLSTTSRLLGHRADLRADLCRSVRTLRGALRPPDARASPVGLARRSISAPARPGRADRYLAPASGDARAPSRLCDRVRAGLPGARGDPRDAAWSSVRDHGSRSSQGAAVDSAMVASRRGAPAATGGAGRGSGVATGERGRGYTRGHARGEHRLLHLARLALPPRPQQRVPRGFLARVFVDAAFAPLGGEVAVFDDGAPFFGVAAVDGA